MYTLLLLLSLFVTTGDNGCGIDPNGRCASATLDGGGAMDPNGLAAADDGRGIDPNG